MKVEYSLLALMVALWQVSSQSGEALTDNLITSLHSFAYVSDIAVLPAHQGCGVAKQLMVAAVEYAKSLRATHCKVGVPVNISAAS